MTAQVGDVPGGPEMQEECIGSNSSKRRFRVEGDRKGRLSVFRCLSAISRKQKGSGSFGLKTERDFSAERAISAEIGS